MGKKRLSVWEKQVEKPFLYRTVQTSFPLFVHHKHDLSQISTNQYHPDTKSVTAEWCSDCVFIWPNISSICIEHMEVSIQSYDQTASVINTVSKWHIRGSDAKSQNNSIYEKAS